MEENLQLVARKFWNILRVAFFMVRKSISKAKFFADLSLMIKRGKLAGKSAIYNLMFHHAAAAAASSKRPAPSPIAAGQGFSFPLDEYEFSCTTTPIRYSFFHRRRGSSDLVAAAMEIFHSAAASPAAFLMTPSPVAVRQLKVTDSPFPVSGGGDSHVDEAAEEFIKRFYSELRKQNSGSCFGYS